MIPVQPGPAYRLGRVQFEGNRAITEKDLLSELKARVGRKYLPEQRAAFVDSVESLYWRRGYRDVVVESTEGEDPDAGTVDLVIRIRRKTRGV